MHNNRGVNNIFNRVFINSAAIIEIHVVGDQTSDSVLDMAKSANRLMEQLRAEGAFVFVIDNLKLMGETTPDARKVVAEYAKKLAFDRLAMVGDGSIIMRLTTNLMLRAIGKSNAKYFSSEESAREWFLLFTPSATLTSQT